MPLNVGDWVALKLELVGDGDRLLNGSVLRPD